MACGVDDDNDNDGDSSSSSPLAALLTSLTAAYHQRAPVRSLTFPAPHFLTPTTQQRILALTHASPLTARYPPSRAYARAFLKALLTAAGGDGATACEELLVAYVETLTNAIDDKDHGLRQQQQDINPYAHITSSAPTYVSYPLHCPTTGDAAAEWITLREATATISQGTTGLVTWAAATRFVEYLVHQARGGEKDDEEDGAGGSVVVPRRRRLDIRGKRVLELGSGPGLLGIAAARVGGAAYVCLTDFDARVLSVLEENVAINFPSRCASDDDNAPPPAPTAAVKVKFLDWANPDLEILADADVLICSDCVYDPTLVPPLVRTLRAFIHQDDIRNDSPSPCPSRQREAWVAVTKRQQSTQDKFLRAVHDAQMRVTHIPLTDDDVPQLFRHEYELGDMGLMVLSRE
ncbi:Protein fam86a [Geranomyces michiganensis]|nr:Protein fam86a [Geranomyces michiganensis]